MSLIVITGPMFAAKTTTFSTELQNASMIKGKKTAVKDVLEDLDDEIPF